MYTPSPEAILAAGNLLSALADNDGERWFTILGSQQAEDAPIRPYDALVAIAALGVALANSVAQVTGDDLAAVLSRHTSAVTGIALDCES